MGTLFVTIGKPGHGKSFIARLLEEKYGSVRLATDLIRKEEVAEGEPTYSSEESSKTYNLLFTKAENQLRKDRSVVLDGTFNRKQGRKRAKEIAKNTGSKVVFLHIVCDPEIAKNRIKERDSGESDATVDIYQDFRIAPLDDIENHVRIDNSGSKQETIEQINQLIPSL